MAGEAGWTDARGCRMTATDSRMQALIDSGMAWRSAGSVGRAAMAAIESGLCVLGGEGHRDFWGGYVPSRTEVQPGTKGSIEYADRMASER